MASDGIQFSLLGVEALNKRLEGLTQDVKYKGGRFALRKAAQVIREKAKQRALSIDDPKTAHSIAKNITERWSGRTFKRTGDLMFRVGIQGGAGGRKKGEALQGLPGGDTRHWRFIEFGTQQQKAQPFMRPAAEESIGEVIDTFVKQYDKALDRAIKKMGKVK